MATPKFDPKHLYIPVLLPDPECPEVAQAVSIALGMLKAAGVERWADLKDHDALDLLARKVVLDAGQIDVLTRNENLLTWLFHKTTASEAAAASFVFCPDCGEPSLVSGTAPTTCKLTQDCEGGRPIKVKAAVFFSPLETIYRSRVSAAKRKAKSEGREYEPNGKDHVGFPFGLPNPALGIPAATPAPQPVEPTAEAVVEPSEPAAEEVPAPDETVDDVVQPEAQEPVVAEPEAVVEPDAPAKEAKKSKVSDGEFAPPPEDEIPDIDDIEYDVPTDVSQAPLRDDPPPRGGGGGRKPFVKRSYPRSGPSSPDKPKRSGFLSGDLEDF